MVAAELFLKDDVAALGAECNLYRVGQLIHTAQDRLAGIFSVNNLFCHICLFLLSGRALRAWLRQFP